MQHNFDLTFFAGLALWCLLIILITWCSGWRILARTYRRQPFLRTSKKVYFQSIRFGLNNFKNGATIGVGTEGLFMSLILAIWTLQPTALHSVGSNL